LAITKERKKELVEEYRRLIEGSRGHVLTSYSGVTVTDLEELRRKLREVGGEFHIVKNSLMKLVLDEAGLAVPEGAFEGTTAVGFATDDIPAVAKAIVDLAKAGDLLKVKGAIVDGQVIASGPGPTHGSPSGSRASGGKRGSRLCSTDLERCQSLCRFRCNGSRSRLTTHFVKNRTNRSIGDKRTWQILRN
jgi:ribosomal protein L10